MFWNGLRIGYAEPPVVLLWKQRGGCEILALNIEASGVDSVERLAMKSISVSAIRDDTLSSQVLL